MIPEFNDTIGALPNTCRQNLSGFFDEFDFVLRFYGPVNPMESCRARSVHLTTHLLGRLSPLSG